MPAPSSVVVVGAGVLGSALADRFARSGRDVTLVERFAPGHVRAGSGDESRLIRCAHGTDELHAVLARRARELWNELDPRLLVEAGVMWFARTADGWEADSEVVLRRLGISVERVDPTDFFPSVRTDDLSFSLFEPEAGILKAREATKALAQRAVDNGARLRIAAAEPEGDHVLLDDGTRLEADVVVWACGAWLPKLFGDLLSLRITQQDVFYFGTPGGDWATPRVPGWVDYDGAVYGMGDVDGRGVKVAPDLEGPAFDPDRGERIPLAAHERSARESLAHRFPALAGAPLIGSRTCQYEITQDTRFLAAPHPEHDGRVWILGGGSGHAFKHGPALAERLEQWIGGTEAAEPAFALGPRDTGVCLRTASTAFGIG